MNKIPEETFELVLDIAHLFAAYTSIVNSIGTNHKPTLKQIEAAYKSLKCKYPQEQYSHVTSQGQTSLVELVSQSFQIKVIPMFFGREKTWRKFYIFDLGSCLEKMDYTKNICHYTLNIQPPLAIYLPTVDMRFATLEGNFRDSILNVKKKLIENIHIARSARFNLNPLRQYAKNIYSSQGAPRQPTILSFLSQTDNPQSQLPVHCIEDRHEDKSPGAMESDPEPQEHLTGSSKKEENRSNSFYILSTPESPSGNTKPSSGEEMGSNEYRTTYYQKHTKRKISAHLSEEELKSTECISESEAEPELEDENNPLIVNSKRKHRNDKQHQKTILFWRTKSESTSQMENILVPDTPPTPSSSKRCKR